MLNGRLYVMGGMDCDKLQVLEMSEENGFSWTVKADLPAARYDAGSLVHEGRLWLISGKIDWRPSNSVAIYDIDADSWGPGPELPLAVTATGGTYSTTLNGDVCVFSRNIGNWVYRNGAWVGAEAWLGDHHTFSFPAVQEIRLG